MVLRLLSKIIFKNLLFIAFLFGVATQGAFSQQSLSPGDITVVTVNADGNSEGEKIFDFVPLVDLKSGTEIKFTDAAYIADKGSLASNEGTITYTVQSDKNAGTVVTYTGLNENGFSTDGSFNPSASGDNIIIYQVDSDTTYLFGAGWARGSTVWEYDAETSSNTRSDVPPGLSEENSTILSLGTSDNYQYDAANGLQGTVNSLLFLIGDEANWIEDDVNAFEAFNSTFSLIEPPTVAFTSASFAGEEDNTVDLTVELVESNGEEVSVDITFLSGSSTANQADIGGFSSQPVTFGSGAASGAIKNIAVTLSTGDGFEGREEAVFKLQNNTEGTIIEPDVTTLSIEDTQKPDIVINEILADPGGVDVDGNGSTDGNSDDEFVEFINDGNTDIDISGWEFSDDGSDIVKTFPEGTVIPSGRVLVLFSVDTDGHPQGNFGGAVVQTSDEILSLNNTGDIPTLFDENGNIIASYNYGSEAGNDQSITRSPDIEGNFTQHSTADTNEGSLFSPGTKVDGTAFGSTYAIGIRGDAGWRMISTPTKNTTFADLFADIWIQGISGSDYGGANFTNIVKWDEATNSFVTPSAMDEELGTAQGYAVYVYEDDDARTTGIQGGFPKSVNTNNTDGTENSENGSPFNVQVTATDGNENNSIDGNEGWNLLGNPFGTDISVDALFNALENADPDVNAHVYIWDHEKSGGPGYKMLSKGDDERIAPFQAFWVRYTAVGLDANMEFNKDDLAVNRGTKFIKSNNSEEISFDLELHGEEYYDVYSVGFSEKGSTELNRYDAYELTSLDVNSISLFSWLSGNKLQKKALPKDLDSSLEVPLFIEANGRKSLTFRWDKLDDLPNGWEVTLIDKQNNQEVDIRTSGEYEFTRLVQEEQSMDSNGSDLLNKSSSSDEDDPRFVLSIQPNNTTENEGDRIPNSAKLNPNYPNPFNPSTTLSYELDENTEVTLTIWNMIGQKVATLIDGPVEAGEHQQTWNASNMPSGIYIARFEVGNEVFTRKMTLIK